MNMKIGFAALAVLAAALGGCATQGVGTGSSLNGAVSASFAWKSNGGSMDGDMTATLSTGEVFSGQYFQITSTSQVERLGPLWTGWGPGPRRWRGEWGYWGPEPRTDFVTHYSGRVVANLGAADGRHMRCMFTLRDPAGGMGGGGVGRCQVPSGVTIDATFPRG